MEDRFTVFVDGASYFTHSSTHTQESLPASNDSWILKLKPSVSYETISSSFLTQLFEKINSWNHDTRQDAFARTLYLCMSKMGPSPNAFFPSLGVFSSEVAMHSILYDIQGHYAYHH
jgi:hypothetical protein